MKKFLTTIAVIVGVFAVATPALAHTPSVSPSCSGLAVSLVSYEGTSTNNRVTITIDNVATVVNFGGSYSHTFTWSQTAAHAWSVVIDANRSTGDPTAYDTSFSGTWQACQVPPTTTTTTVAPTTTTTVAATTTTVAGTTTTVAATATTVGSTAPTTTLLASEAPALAATTTTLASSAAENQSSAAATQLPATGNESGRIAIVGLATLGLGLTLMGLRRRSRPVGG